MHVYLVAYDFWQSFGILVTASVSPLLLLLTLYMLLSCSLVWTYIKDDILLFSI